MLIGRTVASMQVYDTLRALDAIAHLPGVDSTRVVLAGRGQMAVVALYTALLHGNLEALILSDLPESLSAHSNLTAPASPARFSLRSNTPTCPQAADCSGLWSSSSWAPAPAPSVGPKIFIAASARPELSGT